MTAFTAAPAPDEWFRGHFDNVMRELIAIRNRQRDETVADFLRARTPHEWGRVRVLEYDGPPVFGGPSGVIFELWLGPRVTPVENMTLTELGQWFTRTVAIRRELAATHPPTNETSAP